MAATVGADIESLCRKCGDVWHVIVAMVEGDIAKVQCKQCKGLHKYKNPDEADAEATTKKKPAKKKKPAMTAAQKKAAAAAKPVTKATVKPDMDKEVRPYKFSEAYESRERIDHVKFGLGIVEDVLDGGKIEVFFEDSGRRVLAIAKPASSLASLKANRPAWLDELNTPKAD